MVHYFLYWLDIQVECSKYSKNTVKIWNPTQGSLILTLIGHTNSINKLTALKNGNLASGSADKTKNEITNS